MPRKYPRHGFYFLRSREEEEKMKQKSEQAGFYPFLPLRVYAISTGHDDDYDTYRVIFCRIPALRVPRVYAECLLRYLCVRLRYLIRQKCSVHYTTDWSFIRKK